MCKMNMLLLYSASNSDEGALLAQPVEHAAVNRGVVGSSPSQGAIILASWRSGLTHMPFTHALHGFESRTGHHQTVPT